MSIKMNVKTNDPKLPTQKQIDKFNTLLVRAKLADKDTDFLTNLLNAYKLGVRLIEAEFSGSGDSGDMWGFDFYSDPKDAVVVDVDEMTVNVPIIRDKMFEIFEHSVECDWVNNDGGGGKVKLHLPSLKVEVVSYYHETITHQMPDKKLTLNPLK